MRYYYRYEAKGIQQWILASDRLRELKGGSIIIERLGETVLEHAVSLGAEKDASYAGGGGGEFAFPDRDSLESFARWLPLYAHRFAPGLPIAFAWASEDERATDQAVLAKRIRQQGQGSTPTMPEPGPLVARSGRTGLPAAGRREGALEDAAVRRKETAARSTSNDQLMIDGNEVKYSEDLERWKDTYVAVIHADGNSVGQRFIQAHAEGRNVADLSRLLSRIATDAVESALGSIASRPEARDKDGKLCARKVVVGGDDMTVIVTGSVALPFVYHYLKAFEEQTTRSLRGFGGKMTAKAGVVFVKKHWPFSQAHEIAEHLATAAKSVAAAGHSGVRFCRVTTSLADDPVEVLRTLDTTERVRDLTMGTFTLQGLEALNRLTATLDKSDGESGMPRGTLREWVTIAQSDREAARQRWSRMEQVLKGRDSRVWDVFEKALGALKPDTNATPNHGFFEWTNSEDSDARTFECTPILDMLEWKVVQPEPGDRLFKSPGGPQ